MSELELRNILKLLKIISKKQPDLLKKQCFYIYGHPQIFFPTIFIIIFPCSFFTFFLFQFIFLLHISFFNNRSLILTPNISH